MGSKMRLSAQMEWIAMIFCACAWACLCVCEYRNLRLFALLVLRCLQSFWTAAKQTQEETRHFINQFALRGKKKDKLFQEGRHRCSTLKIKGIGRSIPLTDGAVSKYLVEWYPNTYWWTKSLNNSLERGWDVFSILIGSHQWLSKCSRAERGEGRLSLPLLDFGSKRRNFHWLYHKHKLHFTSGYLSCAALSCAPA